LFDFDDISMEPPRSVSLLSGLKLSEVFNKTTVIFIILLVLLMGFIPVTMIFTMEKEARLPFIEMQKAEGKVIKLLDNSQCDKPSMSVYYEFKTNNGRSYYGDYKPCNRNLYSSLIVGNSVPIIYDPKDPSFNGIEGELGKGQPPTVIFILFPLMFLLMFFPMFLPSLKQIISARSIFKKGQITEGEIVFIGRKKMPAAISFKGIASLEVYYSYKTIKGEKIESKIYTDNDWLACKLGVGSPVTIVYMERKPKKSFVLDFYYR
jgi:hypothetical protein